MAISAISISSDSSKESVGTSTTQVILFGTILTTIRSTTSTTNLPSIHDDILLIPTYTPLLQPLYPLYYLLLSLYITLLHLFTLIHLTVTLLRDHHHRNRMSLLRRLAVLVLPRQSIPVGRPYRTQPNWVLQMLTARKRVGPLPTHRLALRYSADYSSSDQFTSDDSSRDSPSNSSSKTSSESHSNTSSDSSWRHSSSGYAISNSLCDLPTATATSSSHKRQRSPTSSVPVVSLVREALSPVCADLLPPRKRIRDFGSMTDIEDSYEPYTEPASSIVVVETAAEEEVESSARGMVEVDPRVRPVIDDTVRESVREDVPDHVTADGAVEVTYETLGDLV
nr:hypothetical protein [Tanacetum cinerariifolium]GEX27431.1 hypothetical protein [Tanacetum cinerariifolium]